MRHDSSLNLMFCLWCEDYAKDGKKKGLVVENNFIRGTSNFRASTLVYHLIIKDHENARKYIENLSKKSDLTIPEPNQPSIKSCFKSNREKLQYEMMLQEHLAMLKYEALNELCELHNLEFNDNYRNRISGREILGYISESLRMKIISLLENTDYFGIALDSSIDVSATENRLLNNKNEVVETYLILNYFQSKKKMLNIFLRLS